MRSNRRRTLLCHLVLALSATACVSDGESSPDAGIGADDSSVVEGDGGADEAGEDDAGDEPDDAALDADSEGDAGLNCADDEDCDDGVVCNGSERCIKADDEHSSCQAGTPPVCSNEHPCREVTLGCDCRDPDYDNDEHQPKLCNPAGDDCDDARADVYPGAPEVCDANSVDEDCDPTTFNARDKSAKLDGDNDRDGYVSATCMNFDRALSKKYQGDDCDDTRNDVHPRNSEVCNYIDDNCDLLVDEFVDPDSGVKTEFGLRPKFYPDFDQDHFADMDPTKAKTECDFRIPPGYIFATAKNDCDDRPQYGASVHPGATEACDKLDNDCDGTIDEEDGMQLPYFESTTFTCIDGDLAISKCPANKLWCDGDDVKQGCQTDGTRLSNCGGCGVTCQFSCGQTGCDEIVQISTGEQHACALTREGRVACWGRGESGRLGTDSVAQTNVPTYVVGISHVKAVSAGAQHSCAIVGEERSLYCWGKNDNQQLGNPDAGPFSANPVPVLGVLGAPRLIGVRQVAAGSVHTCAILEPGRLVCFGQAAGGLLGNGVTAARTMLPTPASRLVPFSDPEVPDLDISMPDYVTDARSLAVGGHHSCIINQSGSVECWGANDFGQLGLPATSVPDGYLTAVPQLGEVTDITAGLSHSCVVRNGAVLCWGADDYLQLGRAGTPDQSERWIAKAIDGLVGMKFVSAGAQFSCATATSGATSCWGMNDQGQLGPGFSGAQTNRPVALPEGIAQIDGGSQFSCGMRGGTRGLCWGVNTFGQLGVDSLEPTIREPRQIHAVSSATP